MNYLSDSNSGFTIIEGLVASAIFALAIITIGGFAANLQQAHRNNQYLAIATTAARDIIEVARNTEYASLEYGTTIDKTEKIENLPLASGEASLVTSYVDGTYGLKRIDVTITYLVGSEVKKVTLSSFIGLSGITQ